MFAFFEVRSLKILYKNFLAKAPILSGLGIRRCFMKTLIKIQILACLICLNGCGTKNEIPTSYEEEDIVIDVERNYDEVADYQLVWDSIFDVDESNYYVYFYSTSCSHCKEIKNFMIKRALEREDIYFVKGTSKDQITNDPKKQKYAENPGDIWILGYPTLIKIVSKKCIKYCTGTAQIKAEII